MYTGPNIPLEGLVLGLDPSVTRSYPGTGSTYYDLSSENNHGTILGDVEFVDEGKLKYFGFNGQQLDRITFSPFVLTTEWTINYWFYHSGLGFDMILGEYNTTGNRLYHRDTGTDYKLRVHNDSAENIQDMPLGDIRNQWAHLGYTVNQTNGTVKGWVNGVQVLNTTTVDSATFVVDTIGNPYTSTTYTWNGKVGSIYIYNREISNEEYLLIYEGQKSRYL